MKVIQWMERAVNFNCCPVTFLAGWRHPGAVAGNYKSMAEEACIGLPRMWESLKRTTLKRNYTVLTASKHTHTYSICPSLLSPLKIHPESLVLRVYECLWRRAPQQGGWECAHVHVCIHGPLRSLTHLLCLMWFLNHSDSC